MADLRSGRAWDKPSLGARLHIEWGLAINRAPGVWHIRRLAWLATTAAVLGTRYCHSIRNKSGSIVPTLLCKCLSVSALLLTFGLASAAAGSPPAPPSTWPQGYAVQRDSAAGLLTLSTPYYTVQHDLKRGGAISSIRLTHGKASNLLVLPFETRVQNAAGELYSDLMEPAPHVTTRRDGLNEFVIAESSLRDTQGKRSGVRVKTVYEYRWGYVKIHKELTFHEKDFRAKDICPVSTVLTPSLSAYGYRDGVTEQEECHFSMT